MLRRTLGAKEPPLEITQRDFEAGPDHLYRLSRLRADEQADPYDLCEYMLDLLYCDIDVPLFIYLLPFCLEAWDEDLRTDDFAVLGFVSDFYPVLKNRGVFEEHLTPRQGNAVLVFMRESILEEIDSQRGLYYKGYPARPYRWIRAMTTYGAIAPDIERIWTTWWSVDTVGRAIAAVQYISCLMYPKDENPVFAPYTREQGGGPPCLWEFSGGRSLRQWQKPNIDFLEEFLGAPESVSEVLGRAVALLADQPEGQVASKVLEDLPSRFMTVVDRCAALPLLLATHPGPGISFDSLLGI